MATTEYATATELADYLLGDGKTQPLQTVNFAAAIEAASRMIDNYCGRRFWIDDDVSARRFSGDRDDPYHLMLPDVATATGLLLRTDEDADGVYETAWTLDDYTVTTGFHLLPPNAQTDPDLPEPYTAIELMTAPFPVGRNTIQVTAKWGWPAVPTAIRQATVQLAGRLWKRKDALLGVGGQADTGFFELRKAMDPDIANLLSGYRRMANVP